MESPPTIENFLDSPVIWIYKVRTYENVIAKYWEIIFWSDPDRLYFTKLEEWNDRYTQLKGSSAPKNNLKLATAKMEIHHYASKIKLLIAFRKTA